MNSIQSIKYKTKYATDEHLVIALDGKPLDVFLSDLLKYDYLIGLVPSISWLDNDDERFLAETLLIPESKLFSVAPLLICPDDLDFSCTVIVAEIEFQDKIVIWHRIGLDKTPLTSDMIIGKDVDWFEGVGPFKFYRTEYYECIENLKNEFD